MIEKQKIVPTYRIETASPLKISDDLDKLDTSTQVLVLEDTIRTMKKCNTDIDAFISKELDPEDDTLKKRFQQITSITRSTEQELQYLVEDLKQPHAHVPHLQEGFKRYVRLFNDKFRSFQVFNEIATHHSEEWRTIKHLYLFANKIAPDADIDGSAVESKIVELRDLKPAVAEQKLQPFLEARKPQGSSEIAAMRREIAKRLGKTIG